MSHLGFFTVTSQKAYALFISINLTVCSEKTLKLKRNKQVTKNNSFIIDDLTLKNLI